MWDRLPACHSDRQDAGPTGFVRRSKYVAAFIGHEPEKALFIGLYLVTGFNEINVAQYWSIPANNELRKYGMNETRSSLLWFDLEPVAISFCDNPKGKLVIGWPPRDKNWYRWAHKPQNMMPIIENTLTL